MTPSIPRNRHWSPILALMACISMIASAYLFLPATPYESLWQAVGLMLLGIIFMGAALWRNQQSLPLPISESPANDFQRKHGMMLVVGILVLALLTVINAVRPGTSAGVSTHVQFLLLCAGIILVALGLSAVRFALPRVKWRVVLPLTAITLLALFLRLWQLNTSIHFLVDELAFTSAILNLRANQIPKSCCLWKAQRPFHLCLPTGNRSALIFWDEISRGCELPAQSSAR